MKLINKSTITINPTTPFDFDSTFHKPDHFPSNDTYWEPGTKWQTMLWENTQLGLKFTDNGIKQKPKVTVEVFSQFQLDEHFLESVKQEIIYRYNLDLNLNEFYHLFKSDISLKDPIVRFEGMRPSHSGSLYEYLMIGIVLQNTFVRRSVQMLQSLFENYGTLLNFDDKELWSFWKPCALVNTTEEDLRKLKLGYRAKAIKRIDTAFKDNQIDEMALRSKDIESQKEELLNLYGIGPATVWYILFDVFHHYDFFNHISPWEQKIYSKLFFDIDPENPADTKELIKYFDKFGKYKQLAVHYIWEDLWWKRKNEHIPWLEKLIRL